MSKRMPIFTQNKMTEAGIDEAVCHYTSAVRLRKRYSNEQPVGKKVINSAIKEVKGYINSSPRIRSQYKGENTHILQAAARFIDSVENEQYDEYGFTRKELFALCWMGIKDKAVLTQGKQKKTEKIVSQLKNSFVLSLMEAQRNYNKNPDNSLRPYYNKERTKFEADSPSCPSGRFRKLLEALDLKHPDVSLHSVFPPDLEKGLDSMDFKKKKISLAEMGDATVSFAILLIDSLDVVLRKLLALYDSKEYKNMDYDTLSKSFSIDENFNMKCANPMVEKYCGRLLGLLKGKLIDTYGIKGQGEGISKQYGLAPTDLHYILFNTIAILEHKLPVIFKNKIQSTRQGFFPKKEVSRKKVSLFEKIQKMGNKQHPLYLLSKAIHNNNVKEVNSLLGNFQVDDLQKLDYDDGNFYPPLHLACEEGKTQIVALLLKKGFDVNLPAVNGGFRSALSYAAENNQENVVKLLLAHKADTEMTDNYEKKPLDWAMKR